MSIVILFMFCISRSSTILECKLAISKTEKQLAKVEVAPYWNVNESLQQVEKLLKQVEVAPYWNVNYIAAGAAIAGVGVEVAPYWNVNVDLIVHRNINI